jgi:hypothetical protein
LLFVRVDNREKGTGVAHSWTLARGLLAISQSHELENLEEFKLRIGKTPSFTQKEGDSVPPSLFSCQNVYSIRGAQCHHGPTGCCRRDPRIFAVGETAWHGWLEGECPAMDIPGAIRELIAHEPIAAMSDDGV